MIRYFIEVRYLGTDLAGFQIQKNAITVQEEVEKAMGIYLRGRVHLTGSSRTDTGVHALQNYFHVDLEEALPEGCAYNFNSLLPAGIAVLSVRRVRADAHCRFDALWRQYGYRVYRRKDPFLRDRAYYYPYRLDEEKMEEAAALVRLQEEFGAFTKRNAQVSNFRCVIMESQWQREQGQLVYRVRSNRFLRGMVRGLAGTMLQVGRGRMSIEEFRQLLKDGEQSGVDFSVPGFGLCLERVEFGEGYFD